MIILAGSLYPGILGGPGTSIARSTPALPLYHTVNLFMYLRKKIMGGGRDCWVRVILMDWGVEDHTLQLQWMPLLFKCIFLEGLLLSFFLFSLFFSFTILFFSFVKYYLFLLFFFPFPLSFFFSLFFRHWSLVRGELPLV